MKASGRRHFIPFRSTICPKTDPMTTAALCITAAFGFFLIATGCVMLFSPTTAWRVLNKAGSTPLINYGELTLRMIPAAGLIIYAPESRFPSVFLYLGWFMIGTSVVLMLLPRKWHYAYAQNCAKILLPYRIRMIAPLSFAFGGFLLYAVS